MLQEASPGKEDRMLKRTATAALVAIACLVVAGEAATATTYVVEANGSGDYATIQDAIDAAVDTDVIELGNGTFDGPGNYDIDFLGKAITVMGQTGDPGDVTIDVDGSEFTPRRGFWFHNGEGSSSVLQDVTVVNGYIVGGNGGAILCEGGAAPTIENCLFGSNTVDGPDVMGGAVHMDAPDYFVMTGCRFTGNTAGEFTGGFGGAVSVVDVDQGEFHDCVFGPGNYAGNRGGGVYMDPSDAERGDLYYEDCIFFDNGAPIGGGICSDNGDLGMMGCSVYWNDSSTGGAMGGGVACYSGFNITNSTFMGNFGVHGGNLYFGPSASGDVMRCIVVYSLMGGGIYVDAVERSANVQCCDVAENTGGNYVGDISDQTGINDNISVEPLFCDAPSGDLTLYNTSPCAPENSPCGQLIGSSPVDCETAVEESSWGQIKASYDN